MEAEGWWIVHTIVRPSRAKLCNKRIVYVDDELSSPL